MAPYGTWACARTIPGEMSGAAWLNGCACHACLLLSETSCEASNRFLDRAVLETLGQFRRGFFRGR